MTLEPSGFAKMALLQSRPVVELIPVLVGSIEQIQTVTFVMYKPAPGFSERLRNVVEPHDSLRNLADRLNREHGIPFWDALLSLETKSGVLPRKHVELAILHDRHPDEHSVELERSNVTTETLTRLITDAGPNYGVAISSRVKIDSGEYAHIPMLDFRCEPTPRNREVVKWAVAAIGQRSGAIVSSGRSFHFYGARLLSEAAWVRFVALACLFSPVVDGRYLAHRLADGACRLRIVESPGKNGIPTVAEVFDEEPH